MSKRAARRTTDLKPPPSASGSTRAADDPSAWAKQWVITLIILMVASIIAAIVAQNALQPDGFIHALRGTDAAKLNGSIGGGPTFQQIYKRYEALSNSNALDRPFISRINATEAVLSCTEAELPQEQLRQLSVQAEYDGENLLTRLFVAFAYEYPKGEDTFPTALDRFNYLKRVVTQPPAISKVETYNSTFKPIFIEAMKTHSARPATVYVTGDLGYYDWIRTNAPLYMALPLAIDHFNLLANNLDIEGHGDEAFRVRQWLGELCFGLIDADDDPSLQLIAARGLIDVFGENAALADPLKKLVAAHTYDRDKAFTDSRIISMSNFETLAPDEFAAAADSFARFGAASSLFVGAAAVALLALFVPILPITVHRPTANQSYPVGARVGLYALMILIIPLAIVWRGTDFFRPGEHPYISRDWAMGALFAFAFIGGALTIIRAILTNAVGSSLPDRIRWGWLALVLFVGGGLFLAAPIQSTVWQLRGLDIIGNVVGFVVGALLLLLGAIAVARVPALRLARTAAICTLIFAIQAGVLHSLHRSADRIYQDAVVTAHADQMAARVGEGWRKSFIEPARAAFAELQP